MQEQKQKSQEGLLLRFFNFVSLLCFVMFLTCSVNSKQCPFRVELKCFNLISEPENKMVMILNDSFYHSIHNKLYRSGISSILVLDETVETIFDVFIFPKEAPFRFHESFTRSVGEMADAGLLNYWRATHQNPKGIKQKIEDIGPQVLTMEHLEIGFQIYVISLIICVSAFVAEVAVFWINRINAKILKYLESVAKKKVQKMIQSRLNVVKKMF